MFISFPVEARFEHSQPEWLAAWNAALATARRLSAITDGRWMFHGTTLTSARAIGHEGFKCRSGIIPADQNHVYWGPLEMAMNFSDRGYDRPALLAALLPDILASGTPLPMTSEDRQCEGAPELPDWQASIAESGALRVRGGAHVEGIVILGDQIIEMHKLERKRRLP